METSSMEEGLKREVGITGVFTNVVNNTIGSGIFLLPAIIAAQLGNAGILAYLACGLLFFLVMLCYAEVSSQVTCSGGTYAYIEKAFGPYAGFVSNTIFWFGTGVFVFAALVNGMADILSAAFPVFKISFYRALFFLLVMGFTAGVNILGVKQGMKLIKLITVIKLVPVLLLILLGIGGSTWSNLRWEQLPSFHNLGAVSLVLFFAFAGGESALNVSGEMKHPARTAPLGLLYGILATVCLFCSIQLVAQGVLGAELAKHKEAPLAVVAAKLMGPWGHHFIIAASVIAIFGILNSLPMVFPRVMLAGAQNDCLPACLAKIHPRFSTPVNAIITYTAITFVVAVSGGFRQLAIIVSAAMLLLYLGVVLATIKFRLSKSANKKGTFIIPGGLTVPVLALLALGCFIIQLQLKEWMGIALFIIQLSVIYFLRNSQKKRSINIDMPVINSKL